MKVSSLAGRDGNYSPVPRLDFSPPPQPPAPPRRILNLMNRREFLRSTAAGLALSATAAYATDR
ncbi:MAG TPA: hypothetical protein VN924_19035, partial [Bryobacteraceae bacterium]|nr:hypothetical protein [Bryobacteraceae bacterium]